jgi:hypothetical protein
MASLTNSFVEDLNVPYSEVNPFVDFNYFVDKYKHIIIIAVTAICLLIVYVYYNSIKVFKKGKILGGGG